MKSTHTKQYFTGCGVSPRSQPVFSYPEGHPCHGCPYTFKTNVPSCTMGGNPADCPWHFYKRLMKKHKGGI